MTWNFQHITHIGAGAGAYTENETISAVDSVGDGGKAWVIANITSNGVGPNSVTTGDRENDDVSFRTRLSTTTNVEINYDVDNESRRIYLTVWEQPSTATADRVDITEIAAPYLYNTATVTPNIIGGTDRNDIVVFRQALRSTTATMSVDAMLVTGKVLNSYAGEFERGGTDISVYGYVPCVEFWGTDYTVVTGEITSHTAGVTKETTLGTSVTWDETLIIASYRVATGSDKDADVGFLIWPGNAGNKLNTRVHADHSAASSATIRYYLISNTNWLVDHDNSIDGTLSQIASGTSQHDITISEISALATAAPVCFAYTGGTTQNYPRSFFTFGLTSTTNLRFYRGRTGVAADVAIQILDTDPASRPSGSVDNSFSATQLVASANQFAFASVGADYAYLASALGAVASALDPISVGSGVSDSVTLSLIEAVASINDFALDDEVITTVDFAHFSATATLETATFIEDQSTTIRPSLLEALAQLVTPGTNFPSSGGSTFDATSVGSGTSVIQDCTAKVTSSLLNASSSPATAGEKIATWQDQSGNSNHITQPTVANQLTYTSSAINTYSAPVGNLSTYMVSTNRALFRNLAACTAFFVFKYNGNATLQALINCLGAAAVNRFYTYLAADGKINHIANHPDATSAAIYGGTSHISNGDIVVLAVQDDFLNGTSAIWVNGTKVHTEVSFGATSRTSDTDSIDDVIYFAADQYGSLNSASTFFRVLLYNEKLSDSDIAVASSGLADETLDSTLGVDFTQSLTTLAAQATIYEPTYSEEINASVLPSLLQVTTSLLSPTAVNDSNRLVEPAVLSVSAILNDLTVELNQDTLVTLDSLTATSSLQSFGAGQTTDDTNDEGLRTVIRIEIAAATSSGEIKTIRLVSEDFIDLENAFPIVRQVSGLGDSVIDELPSTKEGNVTLNNSIGAIGYNRRFSDLFDKLIFLNRDVEIFIENWKVEGSLVSELKKFTGVITRFAVSSDFKQVDLRFGRKGLQNSPITYVVKEGANVISSAVGKPVPLVLGAEAEVRPTKIEENVWAYGTNFANTSQPTHFAKQSTTLPTLFNVDRDQVARQISFDSVAVNNIDPAITLFEVFALADSNGKSIECGWPISTEDDLPVDHILTGASFLLKCHPSAFSIPNAQDTKYIFRVYEYDQGVVGNKVVEAARYRSDFATERASRNDFIVDFVLPKPIVLAHRNTGPTNVVGIPYGGYLFSITETTLGEHLVEDIVTISARGVANASNPVIAFGAPVFRQGGEWGDNDKSNWLYTGSTFVCPFVFRVATISNTIHTKASLITAGYETADTQEKDGLAVSTFTLTAPQTSVGTNFVAELKWDNFNVPFISAPPCGNSTPHVDYIARLLLSTVDENGDWLDAGAGQTTIDGFGVAEANTGGNYNRQIVLALENKSFRRQVLQDVLRWAQGKLLPFGISGQQNYSLFMFGTAKNTFTEIPEEDFKLESFAEQGLETVVNSPRIDYNFRYSVPRNEGGFDFIRGNFASRNTTAGFNGARLKDKENSQLLYGTNYLSLEQCRVLAQGNEESAAGMIRLIFDRFFKPNRNIVGSVPLQKYKDIKVGDVVLISHTSLPNYFGSDSSIVNGVKGSGATGVQLAPDSADGDLQKRGRSFRCLVEAATADRKRNSAATLQLRLLYLPNDTRIL